MELKKGKLLLAEPFMRDPNFKRAVVLICEHNDEGTIGFTLGREIGMTVNNAVDGLGDFDAPLFLGGPVQRDTLHFIHDLGDEIEDSIKIADGIYWGGDFEQVKTLIANGEIGKENIRFFLGYSGWSPGQLEDEMEEHSWLFHNANHDLVFTTNFDDVWQLALQEKGGNYAIMASYPEDPTLN